jgi:hypothetical protein
VTSSSTLGFPQAAQALGVSIRTLRQAIRNGKIPAPGASTTAVSALTPEWLSSVHQTAKTSPGCFKHHDRQAVPPFARYEGTSAWRKYSRRVRAYNRNRAAAG